MTNEEVHKAWAGGTWLVTIFNDVLVQVLCIRTNGTWWTGKIESLGKSKSHHRKYAYNHELRAATAKDMLEFGDD